MMHDGRTHAWQTGLTRAGDMWLIVLALWVSHSCLRDDHRTTWLARRARIVGRTIVIWYSTDRIEKIDPTRRAFQYRIFEIRRGANIGLESNFFESLTFVFENQTDKILWHKSWNFFLYTWAMVAHQQRHVLQFRLSVPGTSITSLRRRVPPSTFWICGKLSIGSLPLLPTYLITLG